MATATILKFWKRKSLKKGLTNIQSYDELLLEHKELIDDIYHLSGVPKDHFSSYYLYSLHKMADYLQMLPASENHHHKYMGGFLQHNLEVIKLALAKRNTLLLPLGSTPEEQVYKKEVWTFAVFTAALMHDIGKIITDVIINLYDKNQKNLGRWNPATGPINAIDEVKYYDYSFNTKREYYHHNIASLTLMHKLINPIAHDWLLANRDAWELVSYSILARKTEGGVIADIVSTADSESTKEGLNQQNEKSINEIASNASLSDKILETLKYITREKLLKFNEPGAPIFIAHDSIYYTSKIIIDKIREILVSNGYTSIPSDNSRLMDEMLDFKIIVSNNNKAIWNINLVDGGFKNPTKLTMLRVSIERIYPDSDNISYFSGSIIDNNTGEVLNTRNSTNAGVKNTKNTQHDTSESNINNTPKKEETALAQSSTSANSEQTEINNTNITIPGFEDLLTSASQDKQDKQEKIEDDGNELTDDQNIGTQFLDWLIQNINTREFSINEADSIIHIVTHEGNKALFLVSPKIFKLFDEDFYAKVQTWFHKLKLNDKSYGNDNIWKVQTITTRTDRKPSIIRGYLITKLDSLEAHGLLLSKLPSFNKHLELIQPQKSTKKQDSKTPL